MNVMPVTRTRPLILNVDDDAANREVKTRSLTMGQLEVIEAAEGKTALELITQRQPLLVLLTVNVPDSDGLEVCRRIKTEWPEIIVIQISGTQISTAGRVVGLESGADCYLTAPIDPMELIGVTKAMLRLQQAEATARDARDALKVLNTEFESRVIERTHDLAEANEKLRSEAQRREHAGGHFLQLQKMEALGQLTGGIAHDFNNLLTAILGGLEVTRRRIEDPGSRRLIDSSIGAARRGAKLITQLMAFARKQNLHVEHLLLNPLVRDMQESLQRSVGSTAHLAYDLAENVWPVTADATQVRTALLNLVDNARDAMPDGGTVRIATQNVCVDQSDNEIAAGDYAALSVQDTGTGMPEDVKDRLFEPFFTTKDVGKGTGLGLAQVYGFVRQSGGNVRVRSAVGQGTTITILLPRELATETESAIA